MNNKSYLTTDNAKLNFQSDLAQIKVMMDWNDTDLAKWLGCSTRTVERMKATPFSVKGRYILMLQQKLREEKLKRVSQV